MATAGDIINRAGKRSKILADEAAFTASEAVDALQLLNDLMHGFGPMGIQYVHATLAATDVVNMPDEQLRNLVLMLTRELLMDFGMPIDPLLADAVESAKRELQAAYLVIPPAMPDKALRRRRPGFFDFDRGE